MYSVNVEIGIFVIQPFHFGPKDRKHIPKLVFVSKEASSEEGQRIFEELMVVSAIKDRGLHITDQVLKEGAYNDVDDLAYLQVNCRCEGRSRVETLELHTASDILLGGLLVELVESCVSKFVGVD